MPPDPRWQDIADAPKDGTWLLLKEKFIDIPVVGQWHVDEWVDHNRLSTIDAIHFMPLPGPPASEVQG